MIWRFKLNGEVVEEPIEWVDVAIDHARDDKYHGFLFESTAGSLEFTGRGAEILKEEYNTDGAEAEVGVLIEYSCDNGDTYETLLEGRADFSQYSSTCGNDCRVNVGLESESVVMRFSNRMDLEVDLDSLSSFENVALPAYSALGAVKTMPSRAILFEAILDNSETTHPGLFGNYNDYSATPDPFVSTMSKTVNVFHRPSFSTTIKTELGMVSNTVINESAYEASYSITDQSNPDDEWGRDLMGYDPNWIFPEVPWYCDLNRIPSVIDFNSEWFDRYSPSQRNIVINGTINVGYWFVITYDNASSQFVTQSPISGQDYFGGQLIGCAYYVVIQRANGQHTWLTTDETIYRQDGDTVTPVYDYEFNLGNTISINLSNTQIFEGDRLLVFTMTRFTKNIDYIDFGEPSYKPIYQITYWEDNYIDIRCDSIYPTTESKTYAIHESLSRTVESITNGDLEVQSEYFGRTDSQPYATSSDSWAGLEVLTTGLQLRQSNEPLRTSFKYLLDNLNAIHCIGAGMYGDVLRVENWDWFYNNTEIFDAQYVDRVTLQPRADMIVNKIRIGYVKWQREDFAGLEEILSKRSYRTDHQYNKGELFNESNFVASNYVYELTRRMALITTEDTEYDNDIFILECKRDGLSIVIEQGNIDSTTNVYSPATTLNNSITPARNMRNWLPYVASGLRSFTAANGVHFTDGEGNFEAISRLLNKTGAPTNNMMVDENGMVNGAIPFMYFEIVTFDYPMNVSQYLDFKANPYGIVKFSTDDCSGEGWVLNLSFQPNLGKASFTLILKRPK